jgi:glycerophosphoryl diester phosphodiesterase
VTAREALAGGPLLIAHRGGSALAPENTLVAFENAARDWAADMVELDVHATADGECVVIHDATVDRTTDGTGAVADLTLAELQRFDAGYRFTPDGGRTFPFRGRGVRIPTFDEVLKRLPAMAFTVEVKAGAAQAPLFETIRRHGAADRIVAAGMYEADRTLFAQWEGAVSASAETIAAFFRLHVLRLARFRHPRADVFQVPESHEGRRVVTPRMVRDLARHGVPVHVWTVDDEADVRRLLDWGVRGLISDRPDRVAPVLHERAGRPLPPGAAPRPAGSGAT